MVKPSAAGTTVFFLLIILVGGPVQAQDYSFSIPEFVCNVSIEEDRSLFIYYFSTMSPIKSYLNLIVLK